MRFHIIESLLNRAEKPLERFLIRFTKTMYNKRKPPSNLQVVFQDESRTVYRFNGERSQHRLPPPEIVSTFLAAGIISFGTIAVQKFKHHDDDLKNQKVCDSISKLKKEFEEKESEYVVSFKNIEERISSLEQKESEDILSFKNLEETISSLEQRLKLMEKRIQNLELYELKKKNQLRMERRVPPLDTAWEQHLSRQKESEDIVSFKNLEETISSLEQRLKLMEKRIQNLELYELKKKNQLRMERRVPPLDTAWEQHLSRFEA